MDKVRVLRIIEYIGERSWVEEMIAKSIHGGIAIRSKAQGLVGEIRTATIGDYPEILEEGDIKNGE